MKAVSNARRESDADESKAMIAEMMKLVGNSAFGRSGMDMSKHKEIKYESSDKAIKAKIEHVTFHGLEELNDACELTMMKRKLKNKNPIHLFTMMKWKLKNKNPIHSIAIYQLAKLRMLQFYYDCIDVYFDHSDFQYQEMDTDSAYIASAVIIRSKTVSNLNYVSTSSSTSMIGSHAITAQMQLSLIVTKSLGYFCLVKHRIMEQLLSRLYYNPKTGYINAQALHEKARALDPKITLKNVKDWYATQSEIQSFQEQKQRFDGFKIASHNPNSWQIDLAFWGNNRF
ncbi:unnamed protein product [Phytophthora lilii]|uniref:Unnamed protein product n=1 Tax=Phytophthora lilii TaxID=2077276 RepID=A0A9W7CPL2_9STRA|nr:unnamed protein product [Phytophthora lilii]